MLSNLNIMCLQRDTLKSTPLKTFLRPWEWDIESQDKAGDRNKNCLKSLGKELMGLPYYLSVTWGRRRTQIRERAGEQSAQMSAVQGWGRLKWRQSAAVSPVIPPCSRILSGTVEVPTSLFQQGPKDPFLEKWTDPEKDLYKMTFGNP